jgi:hypothetical protein
MASQESRDFRNMELGDQSDQTIPNKGWFMYFRLYGVQQVFEEKYRRPGSRVYWTISGNDPLPI